MNPELLDDLYTMCVTHANHEMPSISGVPIAKWTALRRGTGSELAIDLHITNPPSVVHIEPHDTNYSINASPCAPTDIEVNFSQRALSLTINNNTVYVIDLTLLHIVQYLDKIRTLITSTTPPPEKNATPPTPPTPPPTHTWMETLTSILKIPTFSTSSS